MNRIKNYATIGVFCLIIFGICIAFLVTPKSEVSRSERRKLAVFPEINTESVFSAKLYSDIELYLLDHFPLREGFRGINSAVRTGVFKQSDVNGLWTSDGSIFKYEGDMKPEQIRYGAGIINKVSEQYLDGMNVYYSVIPDKNYYAKQDALRASFDYDGMLEILREEVDRAKYIDIFDTLSQADYYKTDTHWSQEKLFGVVERLAKEMGIAEHITLQEQYTVNELYPFYGVYHGQAAMPVGADSLYYLTSKYTDEAVVLGLDASASSKVYAVDRFDGIDGYDVFLSGAQSMLTIGCPNAKTDRELIIFRDSFGSSLAPLFTGAYSKITLIDLRYYPVFMLGDTLELKQNTDVLFLFSTLLLNSSMLMK